MKTIEQHIVHSVWRTIQTTGEKHRIAGIPTYLQDTVDQVLGQPLLPANPTSMQNVPELQLKVVPHHSFQQDLDKQIPDMPMAFNFVSKTLQLNLSAFQSKLSHLCLRWKLKLAQVAHL